MKNAQQLRKQLTEVFADLRSGKIKSNEASELANLAGKMINSAKVQVEYFSLAGERQRIAWLEEGSEAK
jgi:2,3-bisphosphoglycerate-independent phosphoglycerate mutase